MTEQETKIYDATLRLEAAMNLAGLRYEKRSEHTYVDFGKRGYARFAIKPIPHRGLIGVGLESHPAGGKVSKRTLYTEAAVFPNNVIKALRKLAGGVQ